RDRNQCPRRPRWGKRARRRGAAARRRRRSSADRPRRASVGGLPGRCLLHGFLRRLLRGLFRGLLRSSLLLRGGLLRRLLRGLLLDRLLRRLLAEAPAHRLPGLLEQLRNFLQGQRLRVAVLGDATVEFAVADVRPEAAVEHLDVAAVEFLDDPVARDLFLFLDQEHRALEVDGVRVVLLLERGVHTAALGERPEAADADADLLAVGLAQLARELEQLERVLERDRVHALAGPQRGEGRLLLVVGGADLRVRPVAPEAHADRLAALGIGAELARTGGLAAVHALGLLRDQRLERGPELLHQRNPVLLAARDRVELVLEARGEVVVHVSAEVRAEELRHRAADVGGPEAAALHLHVLAEQQGLDDRGVGGRAPDSVLLQRLDQRRFGEARRRLGEVLVGVDAVQRHPLARLHRRQLAALVLVLL